jgi:hypothetical protein
MGTTPAEPGSNAAFLAAFSSRQSIAGTTGCFFSSLSSNMIAPKSKSAHFLRDNARSFRAQGC